MNKEQEEIVKTARLQLEGLRKSYRDCYFKYNDVQDGYSDEFRDELNAILSGKLSSVYPYLRVGKYYYKQFREDNIEGTPFSFSIFSVKGIYLNPDVIEDDENFRYVDTALVYQLKGYSISSSFKGNAVSIVPLRYLDTSGECEQLESLITMSDYIINDMSGLRSGFETIIPTTKKNFERIQERLNTVCKDECMKLKKIIEGD